MEEPKVIHQDQVLRISTLKAQGTKGRALLSFTGIGHSLGGLDVQKPEFTRAAGGYDRIFYITDVTRSWGNLLDFGTINEVVRQSAPDLRFDAVGNSMGGFLALLAPCFLPIDRTVAFVPQFSVHPEIAIWDRRWRQYRQNIKAWKYRSLDRALNDDTQYYVFAPTSGPDAEHARRIPAGANITLTQLDAEHDLARRLKAAGLLNEIVLRCMDGTYTESWLKEAFASAGKSPGAHFPTPNPLATETLKWTNSPD